MRGREMGGKLRRAAWDDLLDESEVSKIGKAGIGDTEGKSKMEKG